MDRATESRLVEEAGAEMRRRGVPITPARVEHFVQTRAAHEGYAAAQVAAVERELAKPQNRGVVASVNTETGEVAVFSVPGEGPRPDPEPGAALSPFRRRQLELERDALRLTADDKGTRPEVRVKAKLEADKIDKLLASLPSQP